MARSFDEFVGLLARTPFCKPGDPLSTVSSDGAATSTDSELTHHQAILTKIGLVIDRERDNSTIQCRSLVHGKTRDIPSISRLRYVDLMQLLGRRLSDNVHEGTDVIPGLERFPDVVKAIAYVAGHKAVSDSSVVGVGCWQGVHPDGSDAPAVLLVNPQSVHVWNGKMKLEPKPDPLNYGRFAEFGGGVPWYDVENLSAALEATSTAEKTREVIEQAVQLVAKWYWKHPERDPELVVGLLIATWIQSVWKWRPQIGISGPSSCGKSSLLDVFSDVFGTLSLKSSSSSAAGLRQVLRKSSRVVLGDEFESSKHRQDILEMIRLAGRGDVLLRGTSTHKNESFVIKNMFWVAAIDLSFQREADENRFIMLELKAPTGDALKLPPKGEIRELGQKLLAIAVRNAVAAKGLAESLIADKPDWCQNRVAESYAVAAAMLGRALDFSREQTVQLFHGFLSPLKHEAAIVSDREDVMQAILGTQLEAGRGMKKTVSELLAHFGDPNSDAPDVLGRHGVGLVDGRDSTARHKDEVAYKRYFWIDVKLFQRYMHAGDQWKQQGVGNILARFPGAFKDKRMVAKQRRSGISIPYEHIRDEFTTDPDVPAGSFYDNAPT